MFFKRKQNQEHKIKSGILPNSKATTQLRTPTVIKLLNLSILLLLGWAILQVILGANENVTDNNKQQDNAASMKASNATAPDTAAMTTDPRIDELLEHNNVNMLNQLTLKFRRVSPVTHILQDGAGPAILCGQLAEYEIIESGKQDDLLNEPQQMRIGSNLQQLPLGLGMIGMRVGEVRKITIPVNIWNTPPIGQMPKISHNVTVKLLKILDTIADSEMPLRRFIRRNGNGSTLRCGDIALLYIDIWDSNGKLLFTTKHSAPIQFLLGGGNVPFGLEQAVIGISKGGKYSFVIPKEMLVTLNSENYLSPYADNIAKFTAQPWPGDITLPKERAIIVDVYYPTEAALQATAKTAIDSQINPE